jgi:hypothetical protein
MGDAAPSVARKQLILAVVLLSLIVGTVLGVRWFKKPPTQPNVEEGRAVAEQFLTRVRTGKAGDAWDAATAEFKSIEGRESFVRKVKSAPILTGPLQFNSSQQAAVKDEPRTEFLFQSPDAKIVRVLIGFDRGNWKVDRLSF